jgi:PAS domain S-box-containing protein
MVTEKTQDVQELLTQIHVLRDRLTEAEETLGALRNGEVDAIVAAGPEGPRVYTLKGADDTYRVLIERMAEGALTLTTDGIILFSNERFAETVGRPLERVIGSSFHDFVAPEDAEVLRALLDRGSSTEVKGELRLRKEGTAVPAYLAVNRMPIDGVESVCVVVTDLTEQKRNEELIAEGQLARSILDQAAEAILVIDPEGTVIRGSRAADRLAGQPVLLQEFDKLFALRLSGTANEFGVREILERVSFGENAERLEVTALTPTGQRLELLLSAAALYRSDRRVLGCIVNLTDITGRKRMEATLRESEERERRRAAELEAVMEAAPAALYIAHDPECQVITGNRMANDIAGVPAGANLSMSAPDSPAMFPPIRDEEGIAVEQMPLRVAARTGRVLRDCEFDFVYPDGSRRNLLGTAVPLFDDQARTRGAIGAFLDITDRKLAEERLQESESQLSTMAEMAPGILFTALPNGMADYVSVRGYKYTGMAAGTQLGVGWMDAIHPEDRERTAEEWMRSIAAAVPFTCEFRLRRVDGTYRWFQSRAIPLRNAEDRIVKWFGTCNDIDDLKRLGQELEQRSLELTRSNEELQHFAHIASHDLQEPLRTIGSMSSLLNRRLDGKLDEDTAQLVGFINDGVNRMRALIRGLLEFASMTQKGDGGKKPIDCNRLVDSALMNLQQQISETGAVVTRDPLPTLLAYEPLSRVFENLIGNGLKYHGTSPPQIHISAQAQSDGWMFSIRDNGIGIDMQYADRIFDSFQRLHTRTQYAGTGLGLSISRKIVERHGGRISVESTPGIGSTFYFTVPDQ